MKTDLNLTDADAFYEQLLDAHAGLTPAQSELLNARLILLLATQVSSMGRSASNRVWPKGSCGPTFINPTSLPSSVKSMACSPPCSTTPSPANGWPGWAPD